MGSQSLLAGQLTPFSAWGRYNQIRFAIQQALAKMQTATLVQIVSCTNEGGVSPVGFVNVLPLVNQLDSEGNPVPHVTIYNLPYLRIQGGANAIILDPQAGDIGVAVFASRDISKVKATKAQANPGSARQYDFSDGLYLGGMLNEVPTQYLQFSSAGVTLLSPNELIGKAPSIQLGNGGTLSPLMTKNFFDFWNTNILPFLQGLGYTGPNPPSDSVTTVLEGQ
jgi:hypothetical protein